MRSSLEEAKQYIRNVAVDGFRLGETGCQNRIGIVTFNSAAQSELKKLNRLVTKRNSTITKTVLKHHWRTVEYMCARGKGYARGACDLEHGGCLG